MLRSRDVTVDEAAEMRISECEDVKQLDRWLALAANVLSVEELFTGAKAKMPSRRKVGKNPAR